MNTDTSKTIGTNTDAIIESFSEKPTDNSGDSHTTTNTFEKDEDYELIQKDSPKLTAIYNSSEQSDIVAKCDEMLQHEFVKESKWARVKWIIGTVAVGVGAIILSKYKH
jgi:hypothetical protein